MTDEEIRSELNHADGYLKKQYWDQAQTRYLKVIAHMLTRDLPVDPEAPTDEEG